MWHDTLGRLDAFTDAVEFERMCVDLLRQSGILDIVHLKFDHYALLVRTDGDRYLLRDSALGGEVWMTRSALARELSGFVLVPRAQQPDGWRTATNEERQTVRGRSQCEPGAPSSDEPCDPNTP